MGTGVGELDLNLDPASGGGDDIERRRGFYLLSLVYPSRSVPMKENLAWASTGRRGLGVEIYVRYGVVAQK